MTKSDEKNHGSPGIDTVSVSQVEPSYPQDSPYDPPNHVYDAVSENLTRLGGGVNPFTHVIEPGDNVVVKANFVANRDRHLHLDMDRLMSSSTHPAVIRPVLDMVAEVLKGKGRITIVDSPLEGSDIQDTIDRLGLQKLIRSASVQHSLPVEFIDLRDFTFRRHMLADNLVIRRTSINLGLLRKVPLPGDPAGFTVFDLGAQSCLEKAKDLSRIAFHRSRPASPRDAHFAGRHLYSIANTLLNADLIINIPKMKTHKKSGVTLGAKSFVGITNRKIWLPHFTQGEPPDGDEFERPLTSGEQMRWKLSRYPLPGDHSLIINMVPVEKKEFVMDGSWQGNNTLWRTILDLVRAVIFGRTDGSISEKPVRKCLTLVDGIIAGEGDGPIRPVPKPAGLLVSGFGIAAVDAACTHLMGFDSQMIPTTSNIDEYFAESLGPVDIKKINWLPKGSMNINSGFSPPSSWPCLKHQGK